tara:strand:- start:441 stop:632 length:192 start_codon:yes stop_codon:yes gene_type:complete
MSKNFIQKERQRLFRDITRQYQQEGYNTREAKRLAKREVDDIMSDKESFVDNFMKDTFPDDHE